MKTLLTDSLNNFEFLYTNPQYRFTDSSTDGRPTGDASLRLTGPLASFWFSNERGRLSCDVAPTQSASEKNWFRVPIVRQYLEGQAEASASPAKETAAWMEGNLERIDTLFTEDAVAKSCSEMFSLGEDFSRTALWPGLVTTTARVASGRVRRWRRRSGFRGQVMNEIPVSGAYAEYRGSRFNIVFSGDDWVALGATPGPDVPDGFESGESSVGMGQPGPWVKVPRSALDGVLHVRAGATLRGQRVSLQRNLPDGRVLVEFVGPPAVARELGL